MKARNRRTMMLLVALAWIPSGAWAANLTRAPEQEQRVVCPLATATVQAGMANAAQLNDAAARSSQAKVGADGIPDVACAAPKPAPAPTPTMEEPNAPAPNWRRLLPGLLK
jgi:hypothetical protein